MLFFNNHNIDDENRKYVEECIAQRQRLNVTVKEADVLTVEELVLTLDYEEDIADREFWAKGQW